LLLFQALKRDFASTNDATELFKKAGAGDEFKKAHPETGFDERTLLCMVLPIRFQNCKVTNLSSVSCNLCGFSYYFFMLF
jgi:hypothetical protein